MANRLLLRVFDASAAMLVLGFSERGNSGRQGPCAPCLYDT
jgi:hypothetical protein